MTIVIHSFSFFRYIKRVFFIFTIINGKNMTRFLSFFAFLLSFSIFLPSAEAGAVLNRIKQTGVVRCGVRTTAAAYAYRDRENEWQGIDIEVCRAAATAVLGRPEAIQPVPVNRDEGFRMLANNEIDLLMAATPWTIKNDFVSNAAFPAIYYYSALAFIAHYNPEATSMKDYAGKKVCVESSPFLLQALDDYNKKYQLDLKVMSLPDLGRAKELLYLKRCDLILDRLETLHSDYFKKTPETVDLVVLPEIVRTFPTGPYIRKDDPEMAKMLRWLIYALVNAEKKGVSSQNIEDFQNTRDREILNLLGENDLFARELGLDPKWLYRTLAERGNYGEIYRRALGDRSPLKIKRSANRLWTDGGRIWAPSFED